MHIGTIKWFNPDKGFGFVARDNGQDVFIHKSAVTAAGIISLNEGDRIEFEIGPGKDGKGECAVNLALVP